MASNTTTHLDYIIVGQGLAGSAVAIQAIKRNKKILFILLILKIKIYAGNKSLILVNSSYFQTEPLPPNSYVKHRVITEFS